MKPDELSSRAESRFSETQRIKGNQSSRFFIITGGMIMAKWVCKVCGYIYEGEDLPEDFICPLCKHGVADFEPIE